MRKRRLISLIVLCAFAVNLGHSLIPHHHHDEENVPGVHHFHEDDHDDLDKNFLQHAFSHFQHNAGYTNTSQLTGISHHPLKIKIAEQDICFIHNLVNFICKPPPGYASPYSIHFSNFISSSSFLQRGPPVAMA